MADTNLSMVFVMFCLNDPATTEIYAFWHTLSLHDVLPIYLAARVHAGVGAAGADRVHRRIGDRGQRFFQHLLHGRHRPGARLAQPLPAEQAGAVVLDAECVTHRNRRPRQTSSRSSRRASPRAAASPSSATSCSSPRAVSTSPSST